MRNLLFQAVTTAIATQITIIQGISSFLCRILSGTGLFLMRTIDSKRLDIYSNILASTEQEEEGVMSELETQNIELRLLASASQVRDHAKESGEWTNRHTEAIEAIADALVFETGWEEDSVHQYMREVVESIDGLEYDQEP